MQEPILLCSIYMNILLPYKSNILNPKEREKNSETNHFCMFVLVITKDCGKKKLTPY